MLRPVALFSMLAAAALSAPAVAAGPAPATGLTSASLRIVLTDADASEDVVSDRGTFVKIDDDTVILVRPADSTTDALDEWAWDGNEVSEVVFKNRDVSGERVVLYDAKVTAIEEDANGNQFLTIDGTGETSSWDLAVGDESVK